MPVAHRISEGVRVVLDVRVGGPAARRRIGALARPGRLRPAREGRVRAAPENALDEAAVVGGEELLGEGLGLEPVAVRARRRPDRAERVEHGEAGDVLGPVDRQLEGDDAAPVVRDDGGPLDIERVHEVHDVLREQRPRDPRARLVRPAKATRIRCEEGVIASQRGKLLAPLVGGLGEAVDEDDGLARALLEVLHTQISCLDREGLHRHAPPVA